jgi:glycosyltransferase involved in cell wall biosynthesis
MTVCYQGPLLDYSGYGEANRHFLAALKAAGVDVVGELLTYSKERADYGTLGPLVSEALKNRAHYQIKIMHTTPDEFERLKEPGKYHIAHFFWETDKIPPVFAEGLNQVNEIWTGSEANAAAIKKGGVDKPVHIIPQPTETVRQWPEPYLLPDDFKGLKFYSIFEWTDRKNPETLIRAFYDEFHAGEDVCLLIKTYFRNFNLGNKRMIRNAIQRIKDSMPAGKYPPVFVYYDLMDRQQIMRFHQTGDVYVSAHRGEGWGVPQVEAMLAGNPVISTGYGGVHEYLHDGQDAMLLDYKLVPLRGMSHSSHFYTNDQLWADADIDQLRQKMRFAFDNPDKTAKIGTAGQALAVEQFSLERVGKLMAQRLAEIERSL